MHSTDTSSLLTSRPAIYHRSIGRRSFHFEKPRATGVAPGLFGFIKATSADEYRSYACIQATQSIHLAFLRVDQLDIREAAPEAV
jgi:hypothetical protein